jgi:hypothetical protein
LANFNNQFFLINFFFHFFINDKIFLIQKSFFAIYWDKKYEKNFFYLKNRFLATILAVVFHIKIVYFLSSVEPGEGVDDHVAGEVHVVEVVCCVVEEEQDGHVEAPLLRRERRRLEDVQLNRKMVKKNF